MSFLSHGRLSTSLQRYIQVDIDDIFVGQKGTRLTPSDVEVRLFKFIYHYQISFTLQILESHFLYCLNTLRGYLRLIMYSNFVFVC